MRLPLPLALLMGEATVLGVARSRRLLVISVEADRFDDLELDDLDEVDFTSGEVELPV